MSAAYGHNSAADPNLDVEVITAQWEIDFEDLFKRRNALVAAYERFMQKMHEEGGIKDDAGCGAASDFAAQISKAAKVAKDTHERVKQPYREVATAADARFKRGTADVLDEASKAIMRNWVSPFLTAKEKREREAAAVEALRLQRLAQEQAAEAAKALAVAAQTLRPNDTAVAVEAAEEAASMAETALATAQRAEGASTDLTRTRGVLGSVTSLSSTWDFEVTDFSKIPAEYLLVNESKIRQAIRGKDGIRAISGVNIFEVKKAGLRK